MSTSRFPRRSSTPSARIAHGESGSAYIVVLLVLFVLTALGLSLSLVTGIESQIGSQERTIQRTFYAADSGLDVALAGLLGDNACNAGCIDLADDSAALFNANGLVDEIEWSKVGALSKADSALSQINDNDYSNVQHYVTAASQRMAPGTEDIPISRQSVARMFALDPWLTPPGCFTQVVVPCSSTGTITTIPPP